jgi:hypothetical protein
LPSAQTSPRRSNFQSNPQSYDNKEGRFCKEKFCPAVYNRSNIMDNPLRSMVAPKNRQEARLQELILSAKRMNIHVRTEKLLREAGYRAKSGSCRVNGRDLILIDRDARLSDQIEFLTSELAERQADSGSSIIAVPSSED